jgi:hypothetical protein
VNFYLLNIRKINSGKLSYESIPVCCQRIFITGEGKVIIGKNCSFGYKLGGFYRGGVLKFKHVIKMLL